MSAEKNIQVKGRKQQQNQKPRKESKTMTQRRLFGWNEREFSDKHRRRHAGRREEGANKSAAIIVQPKCYIYYGRFIFFYLIIKSLF